MKKLILCLLLCSCSQLPKTDPYACYTSIPPSNGLPTILVIGDSISIGYTPDIIAALPGYDVEHNPCNAMDSNNTRDLIGNWLSSRDSFAAITFNNGLWDIATWVNTPTWAYAENLRMIGTLIKQKTANPLFILTTVVPAGTPYRDNNNVIEYNQIAIEVMNELDIPYVDLYTPSSMLPLNEREAPDDVHYTAQGYQDLSVYILNELNNLGIN